MKILSVVETNFIGGGVSCGGTWEGVHFNHARANIKPPYQIVCRYEGSDGYFAGFGHPTTGNWTKIPKTKYQTCYSPKKPENCNFELI